ncbi:3'-5' exonuclease [Streptomyces sp. ISL-99]|uniref:3'-5' exonuclease n=1 Tax=Streptomyces sp. ISL-99 TaxID=2819193 RepID=UPI001BE9C056|nr:3'-5' exonuclease [Streptomyces sp. ISL-99]MBT2526983.1 3'-5' exonuclease [Streptomyces sp. ISL-99]
MAVHFVRPVDTERPCWVAYEGGRYLGALHARTDGDGLWHVQTLGEQHAHLDDAVRVLRRPPSWPSARARAARWAENVLNDPDVLLVDVQTTGLGEAWAVQVAAVDGTGRTLLNELLNPLAPIARSASELHGITAAHLTRSPRFADLLPQLSGVVAGRRCVAYNARFDRGVIARELLRHHDDASRVRAWLGRSRWEDAMGPAAVAIGLWSADRLRYRNQRLGGPYDAAGKCRALLRCLHHLAGLAEPAARVCRPEKEPGFVIRLARPWWG